MQEKLITLITPTFNRRIELEFLYNSLLSQYSNNFIWLIIDDGSTDSTEDFIKSLIQKNEICIEYYYQLNQGKHIALNTAFDKLKTELCLIVDSDDVLVENATKIIEQDWNQSLKENIVGINYLKGFSEKKIIGTKFIHDNYIGNYINERINGSVTGDKAEVWQCSLFKENKFPKFADEKFIGEAMLWIQISKESKLLFKNDIIYIAEYLDDGLSEQGRRLRILNPLGGMAHSNEFLQPEIKFKIKIKNALLYGTYGLFSNKSFMNNLQNCNDKLLMLLLSPVSFTLYLYWKFRYL